jgi:hypothetical protein
MGGCCSWAERFAVPTRKLEQSSGEKVSIPEQDDMGFVNGDVGEGDNVRLLPGAIGKTIHVSASESSSDVDGALIQRMLEEVDQMSD